MSVLAPAFVRGAVVTSPTREFAGFLAPDPVPLVDRLVLTDPGWMRDLHELCTDDVVDLLAEVGQRLSVARNGLLREALHNLEVFSDLTPPLLLSAYEQLPSLFAPEAVRAVAERCVGQRYLDGWVEQPNGAVRAFGARAVHVIAGNNPVIAAITLVRNAVTKGDAIIKSPANDPFTAVAIARTMAEVAPDHPLVRHLAVTYWKGGTEDVERALYQPSRVEKIVAWGGFVSVRHVTRYLQPGLELIALDPKLSATVVGEEAFRDDATMRHTALLTAADVGALNQEGCFNARVIYVVTGTDPPGIERANRWGELLYAEVQALPERASTPVRRFDPELRASIRALRASPDWYHVIGGKGDEGAVLVSQMPEPVEFRSALSGRVANVVPIDDPDEAVQAMNAYTQTVGVYPDSLKRALRDVAPLHGVQRLVSLGYATHFQPDLPQDGMEPTRRMVKWIVDETHRPELAHPLSHLCPHLEGMAS